MLAVDPQRQAMIGVPYRRLGQTLYATAYRRNITGVLDGFALFRNVRKA